MPRIILSNSFIKTLIIPGFPSEGWVVLGAKKSRLREDDSDVVSDTLSLISIKTNTI